MLHRSNRLCAFTLIELLIVVAIIAVLAAIAVPNFLEAQTRAKIARTQADMRSLATAIESYMVDNNKYPTSAGMSKSTGLIEYPLTAYQGKKYTNIWAGACLTTPVAYITGQPEDVFMTEEMDNVNRYFFFRNFRWMRDFAEATGQTLGKSPQNHNIKFGEWFFMAAGPDKDRLDIAGTTNASTAMYDPTNGTVSNGDIVRSQKSPEVG